MRFCRCGVNFFGKPKRGNAVNNAEVDCFGTAAVSGVYFFIWNIKDLRGSFAVNVNIFSECLLQKRHIGNGGQKAEFYLRVVGGNQFMFGFCDKAFADFSPNRGANRDVLQVRVKR